MLGCEKEQVKGEQRKLHDGNLQGIVFSAKYYGIQIVGNMMDGSHGRCGENRKKKFCW